MSLSSSHCTRAFLLALLLGSSAGSAQKSHDPDPSAGAASTSAPFVQADASSPPELADGNRWVEVVPVLLWYAGEGHPRLQVCTADLGTTRFKDPCPILGAPSEVRSVQVDCRGWDCSRMPIKKKVRLLGRVVKNEFVAVEGKP